jgi:serine/threonine-protein kinase
MGPTTFSKHYCVCIQQDGTPREISRLGSVVTYKAIDYRSGRPVALQVIPLTSIDQSAREQFQEQARSAQKLDHVNIAKVFAVGVEDEHIVFVTEYLQGETADAWVVAHGPMDPDAVLRVGLQVVSALAAAMFHSLTHRSIQPSNLMIVPGATAEGEWPLVKLLNFGLAGLKLYSEGSEPRELAPPISPQFASPEQLQDRVVDFRSEIF